MNADILRGKWKQIKGKARQKWGKLTDDDLDRVEGSRDELVGVIQERYGKSKEDVEKEVDAWNERP